MQSKSESIMICCAVSFAIFLVYAILTNFCFYQPSARDVFNKNVLSVVEVRATTEDASVESFGTGEFVRKDGTIITNAHVISNQKDGEKTTFEKIYIRFADSDEYLAVALVKFDYNLDIAVLKYSGTEHKFRATELNSGGKLESGDTVFAIGNAMNYGLAISSGIVSIPLVKIINDGVTRDVIQCDITIAEGNSGGALFDSAGRLIGITTFRTRDNKGNVVYGFAYCVPISYVLEFLDAE